MRFQRDKNVLNLTIYSWLRDLIHPIKSPRRQLIKICNFMSRSNIWSLSHTVWETLWVIVLMLVNVYLQGCRFVSSCDSALARDARKHWSLVCEPSGMEASIPQINKTATGGANRPWHYLWWGGIYLFWPQEQSSVLGETRDSFRGFPQPWCCWGKILESIMRCSGDLCGGTSPDVSPERFTSLCFFQCFRFSGLHLVVRSQGKRTRILFDCGSQRLLRRHFAGQGFDE